MGARTFSISPAEARFVNFCWLGRCYTVPDFDRDDRPTKKSRTKSKRTTTSRRSDTVLEASLKSLGRSLATNLGREIVRGILGSLKRGR